MKRLVNVTNLLKNKCFYKNILFCFVPFILICRPSAASAAPAPAPEALTVRQAVGLAMQRSGEIRTINENISLADRDRPALWQSMEAAITGEQMIDVAAALMQTDMQRASLESSAPLQRRMIELSVIRYFDAVLSVERELSLYDIKMDMTRKKYEISQTMHQLGHMDDGAFKAETLDFEREAAGRNAKENAVDNAYRVLNRLLGVFDIEKRYTLILDAEYRPVKERHLPGYVRDSVRNSIRIKNKENELKAAAFNMNNNRGAGRFAENEAVYIQTERALSDMKDEMDLKIRACYNDLKTLEATYGAYEVELTKINAQITVSETLVELGKITQLELDALICQAKAVEYAMADLVNDYFVRAMQFDFPDLL